MTCAPEERPDATPTGHRVGVEDAESDREDCERRAWRPLTRDTLPRPYFTFLDFTPCNGRPLLSPPRSQLFFSPPPRFPLADAHGRGVLRATITLLPCMGGAQRGQ